MCNPYYVHYSNEPYRLDYENYRSQVRFERRVGSSIRISTLMNKDEDPHHCRCFVIDEEIKEFRKKLENGGLAEQLLEENHGQVFGLKLRLEEYWQIHIKVMPNKEIESEIEPPPDYPGAHLNPEHSYSAHKQLEEILNLTQTPYHKKIPTPITCIRPIIKKPVKPTHVTTIVLGVTVVVVFVAVLYAIAKGGRR